MDKRYSKIQKQKLTGILAVLAVIMVIGFTCVPTFANDIQKAKEEKSELQKKKEETDKEIASLEKKKDDIINYIKELDKELNKLSNEIDGLNQNIDIAKVDLKKVQDDLADARKKEADQYDIMKKRIKYMYENGDTSYIELILESDNIAEALNQVEYMTKLTEYDNSLLDKYIQLKNEVTKKEKEEKDKLAKLKDLKSALTYEKQTVEKLSKDKSVEVAKYEKNISESKEVSANYSSKLEEQDELIDKLIEEERIRIEKQQKEEEERRRKEEERKRKEEEKKREQQNAANQGNSNSSDNSNSSNNSNTGNTGSTTFNGSFTWPVPSSSRITSSFGYRDQPTAGASTYHKGIDIGAPTGSEIVAAAAGTVVVASYTVSTGNYIMISHGNDTYSIYMHCSKLLVSVGDEVSQGQGIALVGSTGISTGPHCHFAIMINGNYVDPQQYVSY